MLVASISFFYNAEADQSKIIHNSVLELAEQGDDIKNAAGPLGAFVSNLLFTEWLGLGSFFLIFYVGAIGATLVKLTHFRFWPLTFKCLILSITSSIVVGLVTYNSEGSDILGRQNTDTTSTSFCSPPQACGVLWP